MQDTLKVAVRPAALAAIGRTIGLIDKAQQVCGRKHKKRKRKTVSKGGGEQEVDAHDLQLLIYP